MIKIATMVTAVAFSVLALPAIATDYKVQWVEAVNNVVKCNAYRYGWLMMTTGPCPDFKPPDTIAIGQQFSEGGHVHVIRVVIATQSETDYSDDKFSIRKGELFCSAAESADDLDMEGKQSQRTWLFVPKCIVVQ